MEEGPRKRLRALARGLGDSGTTLGWSPGGEAGVWLTLRYTVCARRRGYTWGKASSQALGLELSREGRGQEQALRLAVQREISVFLGCTG